MARVGLVVEAARHKKDIYEEKPFARTIAEQQAIVKAVQKTNENPQTGSGNGPKVIFTKRLRLSAMG